MGEFKDLTNRLQLFEKNHRKKILKEKKKLVFRLYEGLSEELEELIKKTAVELKIESGEYDINILITSSDHLFISEYESFFNTLMLLADVKNFKITNGKILLELWYRCWDYHKIIADED